jgi:hypothetical protein
MSGKRFTGGPKVRVAGFCFSEIRSVRAAVRENQEAGAGRRRRPPKKAAPAQNLKETEEKFFRPLHSIRFNIKNPV